MAGIIGENGGISGRTNLALQQQQIDKAIKEQLAAQNLNITNNIVKQSASVPFRNPASYFYGGNAPNMKADHYRTYLLNQNVPTDPARMNRTFKAPVTSNNDAYQAYLQQLMQKFNLLG